VTDSRVLFDALERIADGGCVIDAAVAEGLVARPSALARVEELTERERRCLRWWPRGARTGRLPSTWW
jgi:hypothetical protein